MYVGFVIVVAVMVGVSVPLLSGDARLARWGLRRGRAMQVGVSPYREGTTTPLVLNGAPRGLRIVAGINAFWGVITGLIFVPGGAVLALFGAAKLTWAVLPVIAVVISGVGLAFALGIASARMLRRDELEKVRSTLRWSMGHHAAVLVVMTLCSLVMDEAMLIAISVIPCVLGMTFAHVLSQGVERIELGWYDPELEPE